MCLGFNATGTSSGAILAASVWVGGLATLVENKSRRMELALYCASRGEDVRWGGSWEGLGEVRG